MWKPDICVYHAGCDDGFGAAWAIWKRWGDGVVYRPGSYGQPLPGVNDTAGKNVLFVDFSAKRPEIEAMAQVAKSIVIIDHHKTAEADLEPFKVTLCGRAEFGPENLDGMFRDMAEIDRPPVLAWFDMEQSGAVMAWKFAHRHIDAPQFLRLAPQFLRLIEDRDIWRFKFGEITKQFSASLKTYEQDFSVWDRFADSNVVAEMVGEGAGILRAHRANIKNILRDSYLDEIAGHAVPIVNIHGLYASDVGNALLQKYPEAPFSATWSRGADGTIKYSLRSEDSRLDVSEIAKTFGGGGHRNAAGYTRNIGKLII